MDLPELQQKLLAFAEARDWEQFQSPKNLAMSISIEAAELMEHFQWLSTEESLTLNPEQRNAVAYELADVFMYTLLMAKRMDIDLPEITQKKMTVNEQRYPVDKVKGKSLKHTEYNK